ILRQLTPMITGKKWLAMDGFLFDHIKRSDTIRMGGYRIVVSHYNILPWAAERRDSVWSSTGGMIIQTGADEFYVAGSGFVATFSSVDPEKVTNIGSADEVTIVGGREVLGRRMNGDQDHQGRHIRFSTDEWGIQKVRLYNSPGAIE